MTETASIPTPDVSRTDDGHVATLTLDRPDHFNALTSSMMDQVTHHLDALAKDPAIRVVVITGSGKAFSAGHDLDELMSMEDSGAAKELFEQCAAMMMTITNMPQPVIAKVQGVAAAAGCQLVAQCDLAVASDKARFATSGINLGLFCATPMIPVMRNMPQKRAMELLLTGDFIQADEAQLYGLINQAVPPEDLDNATKALADKIAAKSPAAIQMGKKAFYRTAYQSMDRAYGDAAGVMAENLMVGDAQAGIDAFINKRPKPVPKSG